MNKFLVIYNLLYKNFGRQYWWPASTPFEVVVGAILTQNTSWKNVEQAIGNLKRHALLSPQKLNQQSLKRIAVLIRPAGYFNVKAKRLKNFIDFLFQKYQGNLDDLFKRPTMQLRTELLGINGIGPETADSIILYAAHKPIFVVDAYTKRIFKRHNLLNGYDNYEDVQGLFMNNLKPNTKKYNEYHALIVKLGKDYCRKKPRCEVCPLAKT
ncbi:MAG: endonuclease III domain-containing protein [Candidatus Omnitrophota bacterium]